WVRVCVWIALGGLVVVGFACLVVAGWYDWRAHGLAGGSVRNSAMQWEDRQGGHPRGGKREDRRRPPITEGQIPAWPENQTASSQWALRGLLLLPAGVILMLLVARAGRSTPTNAAPPNPAADPALSTAIREGSPPSVEGRPGV